MSNLSVDTSKRRFLVTMTSAVGGVAALGVAVPFVMSMLPSARAKAAGAPVEVDLTKVEPVRADAHMERGAVYARFLSNPELALAEYLLVLEEYPNLPQAEFALFNAAQVLAEMGFVNQAKQRFEQYLKQYPQGKQRSNAETLLQTLGK